MSRVARLGLFVLLFAVSIHGSPSVTFEQLTVGATAVGLAPTTLRPTGRPAAVACQAVNSTAALNYRYDGTDPTATVGTTLSSTGILDITDILDAQRIKFIRTTGTSAILNVHCWS